MALPQYASPHLGSRLAASLKLCSACRYWKECNRATPVSIEGCASAAQLVGKLTRPSCGVAAEPCCAASLVISVPGQQRNETMVTHSIVIRDIGWLLAAILRRLAMTCHFVRRGYGGRASGAFHP